VDWPDFAEDFLAGAFAADMPTPFLGDFLVSLFLTADFVAVVSLLTVLDLAISDALAPAIPPTTAPTAAPSGPSSEPAAAPAATPPTVCRPLLLFADFRFALAMHCSLS
jgi:hypothetical protein